MTASNPTAEWLDADFVARWTAADSLAGFLQVARRISATVVAIDLADGGAEATVLDIGSGPGDYLATMLQALPGARGIWTDVSPAMAETARERLAPFGDRVSFQLTDMTDLDDLASDLDVIVTSRASHHLDADELARFYRDAAAHLAPGGWVVNLDHVTPAPGWNDRLRAARVALVPPSDKASGHSHDKPLPTVQHHLDGLRAAGLNDVETPWRGLYTCLFMARADGSRAASRG